MPGYDVRILHPDGDRCGVGEEGVICIRLPLKPGALPTLGGDDARFEASLPLRASRLVPDRRRRLLRRGRLPIRHGPRR